MVGAVARCIWKTAFCIAFAVGADVSRADLRGVQTRGMVAAAIDSRIEQMIDEQYPDLGRADEWTLKQIVLSRLLSVPRLVAQMGLEESEVLAWKKQREPLSPHVWDDLASRAERMRAQEMHKVLERIEVPQNPPQSKGMILTMEGIKAWVALNISFFGASMIGSGFVPYDSQAGQLLAPVSVLSAIYVLLRGVAISRRFAEQERQLIQWDEALRKAASDSQFHGESRGLFALALVSRQARPRPQCSQSFGVLRTPSGSSAKRSISGP